VCHRGIRRTVAEMPRLRTVGSTLALVLIGLAPACSDGVRGRYTECYPYIEAVTRARLRRDQLKEFSREYERADLRLTAAIAAMEESRCSNPFEL
jgi:hypothetical protein